MLETKKQQTTSATPWLAPLIGALLLLTVIVVARQYRKQILQGVRSFGFRLPILLKIAGGRYGPYAVLHHVGRRSGKTYTTPVVLVQTYDGFAIPMPFGPDTDWCRNILAAKRCTIEWKGEIYPVVDPKIVDAVTVVLDAPLIVRLVSRQFGIQEFLRVRHPYEDGTNNAVPVPGNGLATPELPRLV